MPGKAWSSIASNEMLTYGDIQNAIDSLIMVPTGEPLPASKDSILISKAEIVLYVFVKFAVSLNDNQIVWKSALII
jgi:hypothetical protein